jgi:hypothetical protein
VDLESLFSFLLKALSTRAILILTVIFSLGIWGYAAFAHHAACLIAAAGFSLSASVYLLIGSKA